MWSSHYSNVLPSSHDQLGLLQPVAPLGGHAAPKRRLEVAPSAADHALAAAQGSLDYSPHLAAQMHESLHGKTSNLSLVQVAITVDLQVGEAMKEFERQGK